MFDETLKQFQKSSPQSLSFPFSVVPHFHISMCSTKVSFLRCFAKTRNCEQKSSSFSLLTLDLYPLGHYKCSKLEQCRVLHVVSVPESSMSLPSSIPLRIAKIFLAIALSFTFTISLWKIIICFHEKYFSEVAEVNFWLDENDLGQYKSLFGELGKQVDAKHQSQHHTFQHLHVSLTQISLQGDKYSIDGMLWEFALATSIE